MCWLMVGFWVGLWEVAPRAELAELLGAGPTSLVQTYLNCAFGALLAVGQGSPPGSADMELLGVRYTPRMRNILRQLVLTQ